MTAQDFCDLVAGRDHLHLAEFLGVSPRTFQNYRNGTTKPPAATIKLLRLKLNGDLSALAGTDWDGFYIGRDGKFYHPFWARGFTAWQLKAMFFEVQDAWQARRDLEDCREQLHEAREQIARSQRSFAFELVD